MDSLGPESLQNVFIFLSFKDLLNCKLVCKAWKSVSNATRSRLRRDFSTAIISHDVICKQVSTLGESISGRFSHSYCAINDEMYVFGGCTVSNTTFNDLWKLDLSTKTWTRMITSGSFPIPKAWASFIHYNGQLLLFGGWTHSRPTPLHESFKIFNHFHSYDLKAHNWSKIESQTNPPSLTAHVSFIVANKMYVFGGLRPEAASPPFTPTNDLWSFDFESKNWTLEETSQPRPAPRYGHSLVKVPESDRHFLIMGGSGGQGIFHDDIWILVVNKNYCQWIPVIIKREQVLTSCQPQIHLNRVVQVGTNLVMINHCRTSQVTIKPCISRLLLSRKSGAKNVPKRLPMYLSRLDMKNVLKTGQVTWLADSGKPIYGLENVALYSLVLANHELVIFGGIEKRTEGDCDSVSNQTHVIYCLKEVT